MAIMPLSLKRSTVFFSGIVTLLTICFFSILSYRDSVPAILREYVVHANIPPQKPLSTVRVPCAGPRGRLLIESPDDLVKSRSLELSFPRPVGGSYEALGLPQTWYSPDARYGPYGYGEDAPDYNRSKVDWENANWAHLQNQCLSQNQHRFPNPTRISRANRFRLRDNDWEGFEPLRVRPYATGRTAIVLRGYEGFRYTPSDMHNIRSFIMEAGLGSESDYAVFLLVDVKDEDGTRHIFHNTQDYDKALEELVPREFRDMAVLFDQKLLESWYPEIPEHSVFFQAYQPLQLFAQLFSGFDHYWQIELDSKITGDSRIFLDALSNFARKEPRKQSIERSSYYYMPQGHGCYEEFRSRINDSLKGGGFWGPVTIPDIPHPIGPEPPFQTPEEDLDFTWGVDEDADLILTNGFASIPATSYWPFKNWLSGFKLGTATPRFYSPVAMGRYSWNLLNTIHHAQVHQALALPSEATPLSFALYHGLKVVFPPHPWFHHPQDQNAHLTIQDLNNLFNGNTTMLENAKINNGLSFGKAMYDPDGVYELFNGATWWWVPGFPGEVMKAWMRQDLEIEIENEMNDGGGEGSQKGLASVLRVVDGEVWAPIMALHPVKSWDFE